MHLAKLIGLGAGLAAAVLFASATKGALFARFFLSLLSMLPIFLAGLGWGLQSALIAAFAAASVIGFLAGVPSAGIWFVSQGMPVLVLCYFTYLSRAATPTAGGAQAPSPAGVQWYPPGRILAIAAAMGGALAGLSLLLLASDFETLRLKTRTALEGLLKSFPQLAPEAMDDARIGVVADIALSVLPAASAFVWVSILLLNLWLAARLTHASGRFARPWPDLAAITLPPGMGFALAVSVLGSFMGGMAGLVATGFTGAFLCAYVLLGLAIVHYVSRGHAFRGFILWSIYFALILFNTYAVLALAVIGLTEPFSPLKRRFNQRPPPPSGNHPTS